MEENSTILLQKQVKDNSEDWQKERLDLNNWEEEMKRKEAELINSTEEQIQVLPLVRSKKKKTIETKAIPSTSGKTVANRIKSYDYNAWDQFDVDAACRKIDEESDSDGSSVENLKETAEKNHAQATKLKEKGNSLVQAKLYNQAIESYTKAINIFPYDEVFFANRALCHLKLDSLNSAEADCTSALQLNNCYVKAYHRRATARIGLGEYKEAKQDIEQLLNLEPTNKEGKTMLAQVNKKLEKTVIISGELPQPIEERSKSEKTWNTAKIREQTEIQKQQIEGIKKMKGSCKISEKKITEISNNKDEGVVVVDEKRLKSTRMKIAETSSDISVDVAGKSIEKNLPDWLPKLNDDIDIVEPVEKPPHQRSKKPMKRLPIKNVNFGDDLLPKSRDIILEEHSPEKIIKVEEAPGDSERCLRITQPNLIEFDDDGNNNNNNNNNNNKKKKKKPPKILERIILQSNKTEDQNGKEIVKERIEEEPKFEVENRKIDMPPVPKTSIQFTMDWKRNKSFDFRYFYLKQISPGYLPSIFQESMESEILSDILRVLKVKFIPREKNVFNYLVYLSEVKRFKMLIMFIEDSSKEALEELFIHCVRREGKSDDEIKGLREKYEL